MAGAVLTFAVLRGAPAAAAPAKEFSAPPLFERVQELRLDNGMLFLLLPRPDTPTVAGCIMVRVGNVDNPVGQTGLAHMFEHMAFKGTDRIGTSDWEAERAVLDSVASVDSALAAEIGLRGRGDPRRVGELRARLDGLLERQAVHVVSEEFPQLYDGYTIDFNAWTSPDFTAYVTTLPANHLEVWMLMESERLQRPVFREFPQERNVVMEERRQQIDDDPVTSAWELLYSLAFTAHPYRLPTIGYMSDLETLTQRGAERFFETCYAPGNCVAALVGGFDPDVATRMIRDYFGDIPARALPPEVSTLDPEPEGERRATLRRGSQRMLLMGFPGLDPDDPRLATAAVLANALGRDATSRLNRRLDIEEHAARRVHVGPTGGFLRYRGVFEIQVDLLEGFGNAQVEELVWQELDRIAAEPPSAEKVAEIVRSLRNAYYRSIETNQQLANELAEEQIAHGDWRHSYRWHEELARVTPDGVAVLAQELFRRDRASVVHLEPGDGAAAAGAPDAGSAP
jgi:predicted Zn-dependent peptidase